MRRYRRLTNLLWSVAAAAAAVPGCSRTDKPPAAAQPAAEASQGQSGVAPAARGSMARPTSGGAPAAPEPGHGGALLNVHEVRSGLISGAQPDGDAAFDELARRGIKTIISVDGAAPDVIRAAARGMRYVHVPVGYDGISETQLLQLAKAVRTSPGAVYVHCHHGQHRGPTAAALAEVSLGKMTNAEATAFLKAAGTAPSYAGLYACIEHARPVDPARLDSPDIVLVERAAPTGLVEAMLVIDDASDRLSAIEKSAWRTPADHPDLVPVAEAGRLADALRVSLAAFKSDKLAATHSARLRQGPRNGGPTFAELMAGAHSAAQELENGLAAHSPPDAIKPHWDALRQSCRDCHRAYRD